MSDRVQTTGLQCRFSVVSHRDVVEAEKEIHLLETVNHSISRQLSDEKKAHKATQRQMASISANAQKEIANVMAENAKLQNEMQAIKQTFLEGH